MTVRLPDDVQDVTLLQLLSNTLILHHTIPYIPIASLLALGATSKSYRALVFETSKVFRHLDLSNIKSAQFSVASIDNGGQTWRNVQLDENLTEDEFYAGPLRGIFSSLQRRHILQDVHTLILDGLSVTSDLLSEIILDERFHVQLLSIRETRNLNQRKLMKVLEYAVRPSRPDNTLSLRGLYIFGPKETLPPPSKRICGSQGSAISAQWNQKSQDTLSRELTSAGDKWYQQTGKMIQKQPISGWAETLNLCQGIISFDAVLCDGPRHISPYGTDNIRPQFLANILPPAVATIALQGCSICGSAPEKLLKYDRGGAGRCSRFPLLSPLPLHSSTIRAATKPCGSAKSFRILARCQDCIRDRYCENCHKWWCEDCYEGSRPGLDFTSVHNPHAKTGEDMLKLGVIRDCWECGLNCSDCVNQTRRMCKICGGGYCSIHNEGSTITTCDWCARARRQTRELY